MKFAKRSSVTIAAGWMVGKLEVVRPALPQGPSSRLRVIHSEWLADEMKSESRVYVRLL
jgi:hypothetical protein